ncbi:MAG: hypothetical protein ACTSVV_05310 [Promethearchaeota archaeon]
MSLDKNLLKKTESWKFFQIGIEKDLIEDYSNSSDFKGKREIIIKIIKFLYEKLIGKCQNSLKLILDLKNFESDFLYNFIYYRDHFSHSFQIFLIGCYLIEVANCNSLPLEFLSRMNKERFLRTWLLISIYHDIGYFSQKLKDVGKEISRIYFENISGAKLSELELNFSTDLANVFNDYLEEFSKGIVYGEKVFISTYNYSNDLEEKRKVILNELKENFQNRNHGIISSLFLFYTLNTDIDFIDPQKKQDFIEDAKIACTAISCHDFQKQGKIHLDFERNPFSSLLILIDNIQEWNRPKNLDDIMKTSEKWKNVEINIQNNEYEFNFELINVDDLNQFKEKIFKELERIFHNIILTGPNFSILFKFDRREFKISSIYNEIDNRYKITESNIIKS